MIRLIDFFLQRYHEDVDEWNFGKLSALREIALAVENGYRYYYMGETPLLDK